MEKILQRIKEEKIISIIRSESLQDLDSVVEALYTGGIRLIEITMNTPNALKGIKRIQANYPDMLVGVGTVVNAVDAKQAIQAGAAFLLSPNLDEGALQVATEQQVPFFPGVFTATEIIKACTLGAPAVKIFPIRSVGAQYINDLKGPLPKVKYIPVGGVDLTNIDEFVVCGSFAIGIGSSLVSEALIQQKKFQEIQERAQQFVSAGKRKINQ
ncbi:bifunctional 4-hydroxy-2-oxoglutarate aldolase/2-dehydro-3-deoxy-phosphogluconate aldolase [Caldibacillus lycopersici]|uniref:Bifunctional 4-hydroxy-2-oxoglutarate aldolase/2-dehydro-3-deoxy-phosphogluconate aldolase n=1 Tax=Perspicuibacillus lycopersici TaxID=1325689 RepID=A0AAE3IR47_9BACI|nr:bifunctional 4-hydroxy-2-oxoglutarate aldolase/2-dehydro-3-deoxy-phosphogluconate aldolase [Perspicuibacillus lycopersici]MCU9613055.1 bifunctional 4-hydroxy-2-oxoglutarate aldolase/2-dehydro-3-deoxy-phosphogluconate aldolase [Perspicuibacillus lycopersici]